MDAKEFEQIKEKVKSLELESAAAKGKQESIIERWKQEYGFTTVEEAVKKRDELKKESEDKQSKRDGYFEKLKSMVSWETV